MSSVNEHRYQFIKLYREYRPCLKLRVHLTTLDIKLKNNCTKSDIWLRART